MSETTSSIGERHQVFLDFFKSIGKTPNHKWDQFYFDKQAADDAVFFMENYLEFVDGAREIVGTPYRLTWAFKRITRQLFGWKRWEDGTRRYRFVFLFIPKKNQKSTWAAALALTVAYIDNEPSPNVACIASDKDQAKIVFKFMADMVRANPKLLKRAKIYAQSIYIEKAMGTIRALSKRVAAKHGPNWHVVIADECHAIEQEEAVTSTVAGIVARKQPIVCYLSTAGNDRTHWFYREYEYAKLIKAGKIPRDDYLVHIYEADEKKWKERNEWYKANPNLGVTIPLATFETLFLKATQLPTAEAEFKRLHLNIFCESDVKAIPMERWELCHYPECEIESLNRNTCYVGVDLANTTDIAAAAFVFPPTDTRPFWDVVMEFWFPEGNLELRKKKLGGFDLTPWAKQGYIHLTPGEVIDYGAIRKRIKELGKLYKVKEIAIDQWEATETATKLDGDGFTVIPTRLGYKTMNYPTKYLLGLIHEKKINHRNNPVLTWMAANLMTESDPAENIKPSKRRSKEKIDGIVALILALSRAALQPEKKGLGEVRVIG